MSFEADQLFDSDESSFPSGGFMEVGNSSEPIRFFGQKKSRKNESNKEECIESIIDTIFSFPPDSNLLSQKNSPNIAPDCLSPKNDKPIAALSEKSTSSGKQTFDSKTNKAQSENSSLSNQQPLKRRRSRSRTPQITENSLSTTNTSPKAESKGKKLIRKTL